MKLLTLNTHSLIEPAYEAKRDAFVEFIRKEQPDVFALQEVNQTAAAPLLADEDNCLLLAQIMARNLIDGTVQILKNRVRPREVRTGLNRLVEYHTQGINALLK